MRHRPIITALVICNAASLLVVGASVASGAAGTGARQGGAQAGAPAGPPSGAPAGARKPPMGPPFIKAAATYLGVKPDALLKQLAGKKTLADLATAAGKSVDGLKSAIIADETRAANADVTAGRITQAQADARIARVTSDIDTIVSKPLPPRQGGGCKPPAGGAGGGATPGAGAGAGTGAGAGGGYDTGSGTGTAPGATTGGGGSYL